MAREIEGVLYRVNFYGAQRFVDCSGKDDLIDYCALQVARGAVIFGVNEIRRDGSTPKVPVLTDKGFKQLVQEYQQEAEREARDEPKVVRTMDELRDYLEGKGWSVYRYDAGWNILRTSPGGCHVGHFLQHDNDVQKAIHEIKMCAALFDVDFHVSEHLHGRGEPWLSELVKDAKKIQGMLKELADGVMFGGKRALDEQIRDAEIVAKEKVSENTEREVCKVSFVDLQNAVFDVYLDIVPEEYKGEKDGFLLTADERSLAYDKAAELFGDQALGNFTISTAEMVKTPVRQEMNHLQER